MGASGETHFLHRIPANSSFPQYGLQSAFSEIERLSHEVKSSGNPISMDLKTRYVIKGIKKEQTVASVVNIFYDQTSGKITKVEDKWDGNLPDSSFKNVSIDQILNPWWWVHYGESWIWWGWSWTWNMWWWQVGGTRSVCLFERTCSTFTCSLPQCLFESCFQYYFQARLLRKTHKRKKAMKNILLTCDNAGHAKLEFGDSPTSGRRP